MRLTQFLHPPAIAAGFAAVLIGYSSSAVIVFQAARAAGADPAQTASWMVALGLGMGLTTLGLSLRYRMPIITAWSTPGAALLVTSLPGTALPEAIGAFLFSALLITLAGVTGWFERVMSRIPLALAAAMLAGVLLQFGINAFVAMESALGLVMFMFIVYLAAKRLAPRYAILFVLAGGFGFTWLLGGINFSSAQFSLPTLSPTLPVFHWPSLVGIGIPLFVVTMVSQNIPGYSVLRNAGYQPPLSTIVGTTGLATLLLAPFGGFALNLAAITAAICAGPEAHQDPGQRYLAGVSTGVFYLLLGFGGGAVAAFFAAFPTEFVLALAGLALLPTIAGSLHNALAEAGHREAAIITFVVTASGLELFAIGSAFWGLIAGVIALLILSPIRRQS